MLQLAKIKKIYPGTHSLQNRVSLHELRKGSITAEASLAFPLFFMVVICIASIMNLYGMAVSNMSSLRDLTETAAVAAGVSEDARWIDVTKPEYFKPFFLPDSLSGVFVPARGRVRAWNGRSAEETEASSGGEAEYVYLTENASVYHTNPACSHLELSTRGTAFSQVSSLRNASGAKYKPCEKCCRNGCAAQTVYITDDGDRYHSSAECSGLKRTVRLVPVSSIEGICECSRCAASRTS